MNFVIIAILNVLCGGVGLLLMAKADDKETKNGEYWLKRGSKSQGSVIILTIITGFFVLIFGIIALSQLCDEAKYYKDKS